MRIITAYPKHIVLEDQEDLMFLLRVFDYVAADGLMLTLDDRERTALLLTWLRKAGD